MNMPGTPEMILIFVVILILFGPKSLPQLGRALGQTIREFKEASNKITESVMSESEAPVTRRLEPREAPVAAKAAEPAPVEKKD
ncbi:twin-arginine translocase TatA/TatE family subunit [bacterium]|nr:twin-arginine translocase TatA/TatE family subunit [bacterium]